MKTFLVSVDALLVSIGSLLCSPLLFLLRAYFGWQFALTGWGKLTHLDRTTEFFSGLGLPLPAVNALLAGSTEAVGGVLLAVGLGARWVSVPLAFTMIVAYLTADRDALLALGSEPDKFTSAAPFLFLLTSLLVLAFGPGAWSLDRLRQGHGATRP